MAVQQVASSHQNDGNFSQLDLQDIGFGGPLMRIETFRCSQPMGVFGRTAAGTSAQDLCGNDHLVAVSNRIFRHVFSVETPRGQAVTLEFREQFGEAGELEVTTRDLWPSSPTFGSILVQTATPVADGYRLTAELIRPAAEERPDPIPSPLPGAVASIAGLPDIAVARESLARAAVYRETGEVNVQRGERGADLAPLTNVLSLE